eukprot:XP_025013835.1 uncharacterized protein LOC112535492 [Ricinus communis]
MGLNNSLMKMQRNANNSSSLDPYGIARWNFLLFQCTVPGFPYQGPWTWLPSHSKLACHYRGTLLIIKGNMRNYGLESIKLSKTSIPRLSMAWTPAVLNHQIVALQECHFGTVSEATATRGGSAPARARPGRIRKLRNAEVQRGLDSARAEGII